MFWANAQNAGLLASFGIPPEANIDESNAAKLVPFAIIVGFQAFFDTCAFLLSHFSPGARQQNVKVKSA